jgi:hypothetical protein
VKYSHYGGFNGTPQVLAAPPFRPQEVANNIPQPFRAILYTVEKIAKIGGHILSPRKAQSLMHVKSPRLTVFDYEYKYWNISRALFIRTIYLR